MATFAELSVFNKMLLDKMQKMEKENNELKKENKILIERLDNAQNILEDENFSQCIDCCLYYDSDGLEFGEMGSGIRCRECDIKNEKEKEEEGLFKCNYCCSYRFGYKMEELDNGKLRCCECDPRNK